MGYTSVIPVLRRLRLKDAGVFKANLSIVRSCLQKRNKTEQNIYWQSFQNNGYGPTKDKKLRSIYSSTLTVNTVNSLVDRITPIITTQGSW
jgi:hypothetical protein